MINYIKRVILAILGRPVAKFSMEKNYVIYTGNYKRFQNKIAVVTGASGAIGSAIAWRLGVEGAFVYLASRNEKKLYSLAEEMKKSGIECTPLITDVTNEKSIENAANKIIKDRGTVDILINCAGGSTRDKCTNFVDQSIEMINEMLEVNLRGSMLCTRTFGRIMINNNAGKIVNISSIIGEHGKPKFSDYAAAKAGIIGFTKSIAQELGAYGINVNSVSPGFIQRGTFNDRQLPYLLNSNFLKKVGCAEDVASAVAFLVSDEANFITGHNLCVDGGRSLGLHGD